MLPKDMHANMGSARYRLGDEKSGERGVEWRLKESSPINPHSWGGKSGAPAFRIGVIGAS